MTNGRQKGAVGEREISKILREHGYSSARRGQQYCGTSGEADVVGIPGVHIEVKRVENHNLDKAMAQSVRDARENETPVVFHRKNRTEWKVTLFLEDYLNLLKGSDAHGHTGNDT